MTKGWEITFKALPNYCAKTFYFDANLKKKHYLYDTGLIVIKKSTLLKITDNYRVLYIRLTVIFVKTLKNIIFIFDCCVNSACTLSHALLACSQKPITTTRVN